MIPKRHLIGLSCYSHMLSTVSVIGILNLLVIPLAQAQENEIQPTEPYPAITENADSNQFEFEKAEDTDASPLDFEKTEDADSNQFDVEKTESDTVAAMPGFTRNDLRSIDLTLAPKLKTPDLKPVPNQQDQFQAVQSRKLVQWTAPNDVYQNLFFEDPLLERHGINTGVTRFGLLRDARLQPVVSGMKFLTSSALLPLDLLKRHHKNCDNPLGWGVGNSY